MKNLDHNLATKQELSFKDGKFKILMMSDLQETLDFNERTLRDMDKLVESVKPDFVMLGGDNCNGLVLKKREELEKYLEILSSPMEKRGIPWAHVFGNHDHDVEVDEIEHTCLYEKYKFCVSKHTEGICGATNYVLPILSSDSSHIAFNLWGLDTNNLISDSNMNYEKDMKSFVKASVSGSYDVLRFEQLMWYWNTSKELEEYNKSKINGIMFMHVAPWEFQYIIDNPERTGAKGSMVEPLDLGTFNSGIFSAVLQRGDIRCIACAHTHIDCFEGTFCGVKMCLDACAGYSAYGEDELRGGRVFELDEKNTSEINTYMVHYKDI